MLQQQNTFRVAVVLIVAGQEGVGFSVSVTVTVNEHVSKPMTICSTKPVVTPTEMPSRSPILNHSNKRSRNIVTDNYASVSCLKSCCI